MILADCAPVENGLIVDLFKWSISLNFPHSIICTSERCLLVESQVTHLRHNIHMLLLLTGALSAQG